MQLAKLKPQVGLGLLTLDDVRRWIDQILAAKTPPTAIFALNHRTSVYVLQALTERNIKIPEQIALVGFDDFELSNVIRPALTTVHSLQWNSPAVRCLCFCNAFADFNRKNP